MRLACISVNPFHIVLGTDLKRGLGDDDDDERARERASATDVYSFTPVHNSLKSDAPVSPGRLRLPWIVPTGVDRSDWSITIAIFQGRAKSI
jgi:hypothetical protein